MVNIDLNNNPHEKESFQQYMQSPEYLKQVRMYEVFSELGLIPGFDGFTSDTDWHPSNYDSFNSLLKDRSLAIKLYFETDEIPDDLKEKLKIAYKEECNCYESTYSVNNALKGVQSQ